MTWRTLALQYYDDLALEKARTFCNDYMKHFETDHVSAWNNGSEGVAAWIDWNGVTWFEHTRARWVLHKLLVVNEARVAREDGEWGPWRLVGANWQSQSRTISAAGWWPLSPWWWRAVTMWVARKVLEHEGRATHGSP